jgi:predicted MFS family arabinose efflux permease
MKWLIPLAVRAPYSLLMALMLVELADEWVSFFPAGSIASIQDDLGLSYAQAGAVLTSVPAGGILGHGFGVAADFVSRRALAVFGAAMYAVCMGTFALADSFAVLVVAGFVWGAASDAFIHGCEVALVDLYRDQLAPALARVNAFGAVGDLLGPLTLAGAAAAGVSWRAVFALGAATMALYAVWLFTQRFPPPAPPEAEEEHTPFRAVLGVLRDRRILLLAVIAGLFSVLDEPFWGFVIVFLEDVRGLSGGLATAIAAVGVAGGLAGFLSVGAVTARWSARTTLLATCLAVGASVAALVYVPFPPAQTLGGLAFGYSGALFWSVLQAATLGLRPGQAGTTSAVVSTVGLFGIGYPPLVGAVADRAGLPAGLGLYAAVPALMFVLLLFVRVSPPLAPPGGETVG